MKNSPAIGLWLMIAALGLSGCVYPEPYYGDYYYRTVVPHVEMSYSYPPSPCHHHAYYDRYRHCYHY